MSTTVEYKGATLTTATNQTRTLDTAGTYLEDDITITDVTTIPTGTKNISITANGTTTEDVTSYATANITANVPNSYSASDEGKVVSNGSLVSQTSATYTANDTYDTTTVSSVTVNVSGGGGISVDDFLKRTEPTGDLTYTGTTLGQFALSGTSITSFTGANVTSVGVGCFCGCQNLASISLPSLQSISTFIFTKNENNNAFKLPALTSLNLPAVKTITAQIFAYMPLLTRLNLPSLTATAQNGFNTVGSGITTIDIGSGLSQIGAWAFNGASNALTTVILRKSDGIVTLATTNGIPGRAITYYVPNSLISTYQTASNWVTAYTNGNATFVKIEGSPYE